MEPFESKLDKIGEWEEPLEYFNTVKQNELQAKLLKEDQKITEKDLERMEIQRITERILNGEDFSPDRDSIKSRTSPSRGRSRSPYRLNATSRPSSQNSRGRSASAEKRAGNTDSNGGQKILEKSRKPLDFMNLFHNQPDADFYPQPSKVDSTANSLFSPNYRNRSRSGSPLTSPFSPSQRYSPSPKRGIDRQRVERGRLRDRKASPTEDKRFIHRKTKKNIHKIRSSLFFGESSQEKGKERALSFLQKPLARNNSTNSAIGFLANEESLTVHSSSVASDSLQSLSLVNNEYAEVCLFWFYLNQLSRSNVEC